MASSNPQSNSLIGSLLGKDYRVLEQIGIGGMATVYLVEHQTLLKNFAAKVLSAEHASNKEARARFAQEAHAASQLDHENIVTISDFGITSDERPFYIMELLRGRTLMARLEEGPMTLAEVVAVSVPVARALAHAHAEGVIHRDVKPENVFLVQRTQGRWGVKVLDFGIAKVTSNPSLTKMGQALGSPMFMAPEACRGDDVDQRADLYSFGIILYLMLTGRVPFEDESLLKVLQMQVSAPVQPLRDLNPDLSEELEAVVMRALEKNPDDRYPTMEAMLFDLQLALPDGSDALLHQAQFVTAPHDTPFPSQSLRMMAVSSQRHMIGDQDASKQLVAAPTSQRFPLAPPQRKRGTYVALGIAALLAGSGGVFLYSQLRGSGSDGTRTEPVAAATPAPTPVPAPSAPALEAAAIEPPAPPPVGDTPVDNTAVDNTPAEPEPVKATGKGTKAQPKKIVRKPEPPPKKVAAKTVARVETAKPTVAAGSGSAVVAPPPNVAAVSVTPTVVNEPAPRVEPAGPGSAAPTDLAPKKPVVAAPVDVGSLDATATIASLEVNGPLPTSVVRRSVERVLPALRTCYRTAAKAGNKTPAANLTVSFEVDESAAAVSVSANGTSFGSLASCAKGAIGRLQTQQAPDVGTVNVVVAISFRPVN